MQKARHESFVVFYIFGALVPNGSNKHAKSFQSSRYRIELHLRQLGTFESRKLGCSPNKPLRIIPYLDPARDTRPSPNDTLLSCFVKQSARATLFPGGHLTEIRYGVHLTEIRYGVPLQRFDTGCTLQRFNTGCTLQRFGTRRTLQVSGTGAPFGHDTVKLGRVGQLFFFFYLFLLALVYFYLMSATSILKLIFIFFIVKYKHG